MYIWNLRYGLLFLGCLAAAANVEAATYFGYNKSGDGTVHDVNVGGDPEEGPQSRLCWAAAASNILDWGGWGRALEDGKSQTFRDLHVRNGNSDKYVYEAWEEWFTNYYPAVKGEFQQLPLSDDFVLRQEESPTDLDLLDSLKKSLGQGMGTTLRIAGGESEHDLTVWGYDYTQNTVTGIYYTDSHDGALGRQYVSVSKSEAIGPWKIGGQTAEPCSGFACKYQGWSITKVQSLAVRELSLLSGTWLSLSTKDLKPTDKSMSNGSPNWTTAAYDDSAWTPATKPFNSVTEPKDIIDGTIADLMWVANDEDGKSPNEAYFRLNFNLTFKASDPFSASLKVIADDVLDLWVNGKKCWQNLTLDDHLRDNNQPNPVTLDDCNANDETFSELLDNGDNVIAIRANDGWPDRFEDRGYQYVFVDGLIQTFEEWNGFREIPEPTTMALFGSAFMGLLVFVKGERRRLMKHGRTGQLAATLMSVSYE